MWQKIKDFLIGLLYEGGEPSLTRFILLGAFIVFIIGTCVDVWLVLNGKVWTNYITFATVSGGGAVGGKIADKITNSLANSPRGETYAKSNK